MALSDSIDIDSFETAHQLTLSNVKEDQLEADFIPTLTRYLISELDRAGAPEVRSNREKSSSKIEAALRSIEETKGQEWSTVMRSAQTLRYALWNVLASRATYSEMPETYKRITQSFKAVSESDHPKESKA